MLKKINVPVMVILGRIDTVVSNPAAKSVFEALPDNEETKMKELVEFDELCHGPFSNALMIDKVINESHNWF